MPITTKVVSSNPTHGKVQSIQDYVIKFISDLWQVSGFLRVLQVSSTNKSDWHDIDELLLNTISQTTNNMFYV